MKQDEYGFTLVNFNEMLPFVEDSFAFLIHVEQILFSDDTFLNLKALINSNKPLMNCTKILTTCNNTWTYNKKIQTISPKS
jgi:hypothetical protein